MLQHTKIKTDEEMEEEKEKAKEKEKEIINKDIDKKENGKEEEKAVEEKEVSQNENKTESNSGNGLGFFGRLMAPIFLTETEIDKIKGKQIFVFI